MSALIDLSGQRFGKLKVAHRSGSDRTGKSRWLCACDCGRQITISSDHLRRKTNPVRSCGCRRGRRETHYKWTGCGDITGNWWNGRILRERNQTYRPKVTVTITIKYAWWLYKKQNGLCALSGLPIIINDTNEGTASLDRIDNSQGYVKGNVQWVHKDINFMKRNYDQEYFVQLCMAIADHSGW